MKTWTALMFGETTQSLRLNRDGKSLKLLAGKILIQPEFTATDCSVGYNTLKP